MHIGLDGHLRPASRLGAVLAQQGHHVVALGPIAYREQLEAPGVEFQEHEPFRFPPSRLIAAQGPVEGVVGFSAALADATALGVERLINWLFDQQVDLVVHDIHVPWARVAADFLGLPRVVSNPLFPAPGRPSQPPASVDRALARLKARRLEIGRRWGVDIGDWVATMLNRAQATISYTTQTITGVPPLDGAWSYVGPLMERRSFAPSARDRPLVYVALGTFYNYRAEVFKAVLEALNDAPVDVLVSTGRGVSKVELEPLPENVRVYEFVRSRSVLEQASVHVTHGGSGSVHESLLAGVPMVCIPQGADQYSWSERVQAVGAGELSDATAGAIRVSVDRALSGEDMRCRAREIGEELACYDGERRVAELIERVLA